MKKVLKLLTHISRFIIGIVFVYSGFVKLVDPIGTKIKMIEYFAPDVLNMEFFVPYALPISILLILAELVLGVMILTGFKPKFAVWSTFALTVVFLFLTWYSYAYNKVTDCGCFGDAIKLSTAETFYKNVVFIILIIIMIIGLKYIKPLFNKQITLIIPFATLAIAGVIAFYCLNHLPIIDFRAYAVGKDIAKGIVVQKGDDFPKMKGFSIENAEGNNIEKFVNAEKSALILVHHIQSLKDDETISKIKKVYETASSKGYLTFILSDIPPHYADPGDIPAVLEKLNLGGCDTKALKTAIRSEYGVITAKKGVISGKWNLNDADDIEF